MAASIPAMRALFAGSKRDRRMPTLEVNVSATRSTAHLSRPDGSERSDDRSDKTCFITPASSNTLIGPGTSSSSGERAQNGKGKAGAYEMSTLVNAKG